MSNQKEYCKCCKFARKLELPNWREPQLCCLRYAPKPKMQSFDAIPEHFYPVYPNVEDNMWCGEFERWHGTARE